MKLELLSGGSNEHFFNEEALKAIKERWGFDIRFSRPDQEGLEDQGLQREPQLTLSVNYRGFEKTKNFPEGELLRSSIFFVEIWPKDFEAFNLPPSLVLKGKDGPFIIPLTPPKTKLLQDFLSGKDKTGGKIDLSPGVVENIKLQLLERISSEEGKIEPGYYYPIIIEETDCQRWNAGYPGEFFVTVDNEGNLYVVPPRERSLKTYKPEDFLSLFEIDKLGDKLTTSQLLRSFIDESLSNHPGVEGVLQIYTPQKKEGQLQIIDVLTIQVFSTNNPHLEKYLRRRHEELMLSLGQLSRPELIREIRRKFGEEIDLKSIDGFNDNELRKIVALLYLERERKRVLTEIGLKSLREKGMPFDIYASNFLPEARRMVSEGNFSEIIKSLPQGER